MKKALIIANMMFASTAVFGMENSRILQQSSELTQRFVTALQSEDVERVEQSIRDGADVNNTEIDGTTPLIFAVKNDDRPLVKTLILSGANVDAEDSQHETALSAAIDLEYDFTVRVLVNMGGADIYKNGAFDKAMQGSDRVRDCFEYLNVRFLTEAVKNNDVDRVEEALKDERVNINGRDYNGYTPLMYAAAGGHLDIIDLLLYNGAQVAAVSKKPADYDRCVAESFGDNALFFAARNGKTESLDRLMGVSINKVKEAVMKSNKKEDLKRNINRAAIAAMRGAEIALTRRNNLGQTLLISALKNGREDTAIWLIDHGADVNSVYSAKYVNPHNETERTYEESPLMIAAELGITQAVEKLLAEGANINFRNDKGTVLDYILRSNEGTLTTELKDQFAKMLIDRGIQIDRPRNLLFWSARNGYLEMTKSLLNRVDDINFRNQNNETPFMVALKAKHLDVSEVLFSDEVNLDEAYVYIKEERDYWDNIIHITYEGTILTWAARNSDGDVMEWLIRHGANLDVMESIRKHSGSKWSSTTTSYRESLLSIVQKRFKGRRVFDMITYYDSLESIVDMFRKAEAAAR